jgi:hypothetical protein
VNSRETPKHPSLHFKRIHGHDSIYSVPVTLGYRALALVENNEATWFWIGCTLITTVCWKTSNLPIRRGQASYRLSLPRTRYPQRPSDLPGWKRFQRPSTPRTP